MNTEGLIYYMTHKEVLGMTKIPKSSLPKYIEEEGFPEPVDGTTRVNFWVLSEVQAWMQSRIDRRDQKKLEK